MEPNSNAITKVLCDLRSGTEGARQRLIELVYEELRSIAGSYFRRQPMAHTLQPTALVHEAFVRMADEGVDWQDRAHFLAACAVAMRDILREHARRRRALKRGGDLQRVTLSGVATPSEDVDALALDEALTHLATLSKRQARVVECRFFANMTIEEAAHALGVSKRTVDDDWAMARAWLSTRLTGPRPA